MTEEIERGGTSEEREEGRNVRRNRRERNE